tara:strand:- start:4272 stop:5342 length:1071 start_codon:yes stop_codon:yes gene_type:complete
MVGCGTQPKLSSDQVLRVDAAVESERERQGAVGVAVGIISNGEIVYLRGYGFADREEQIPVSLDTMFRWASISKPVTAIAAMQLAEQGKLNLDDDVRKHVPEFPDKGERITVRDLLCHQGGIVHYSNGRVIRTEREYDVENPFEDVINALDTFKESPLVAKPGTEYSYTTHGYILLSAVIQRAGGEPFVDQVRKRIVWPSGAIKLQPDYQWKEIANRAVGYRKNDGEIVRDTDTDVSWKLGGGGFISTIEDLAKFAAALIEGRLLHEDSEKVMWQAQSTAEGKMTKYGLGFSVSEENGELKVSHNGSQEKARCRMVIYPESEHGVVVMSNSRFVDPGRFSTAVYSALRESGSLSLY